MSVLQETRSADLIPGFGAAAGMPSEEAWARQLRNRKRRGEAFAVLGVVSVVIALGVLAVLVIDVLRRGVPWLSIDFLTSFDSRFADRAGIRAGLVGSLKLERGMLDFESGRYGIMGFPKDVLDISVLLNLEMGA